ncbi:1-phosphofructokinase [Carnobacteriaceae bacterium zg-84]|uniref:1-phosphofructokinase n=1 Tax=Granulicatella sp. zg-84 TaxID=2678503 RepID=UPI0013BF200B|nr:1-phosphofructokinase [Granulicatella sp. zg-84]NEW66467.1 1-phosphofructokinase [Granulicatella sp. zg-84]QMI86010.1 1-phosphofructokinase [Carnobacteriaceae bacterium zg-84]
MLYTITFNPAVDLVINVPSVTLGDLNRSVGENYVAGGKGINMSVILKRLGFVNTAVAFLGGFSGTYIQSELEKDNIIVKRIEIDGITRINVKLKSQEETEINANGAYVSKEKFEELYTYFENVLTNEDTVFLAGNKAPGMTSEHYVMIAKLCQEKGTKLVLDTTKELLTQCLPYEPFIIKPNHHELGELFDVVIDSEEQIIHYAKQLQKQGAKNVLVSRGKEGSLLVTTDGQIFTANVPKGTVVNSVGAGDSMLAGFMSSYLQTGDYMTALKQGAATGSATAFSVGIATLELIDTLLPQITVTKIQ